MEDLQARWDRRATLAQAQTLGVDEVVADAEPTRAIAELVISAMEFASLRGAGIPHRLAFRREGGESLRMATNLARQDSIVINLDDRFWDDPKTIMRQFADQRLFPSTLPIFPILHELGHRTHYLALNDPNRWFELRTMRLDRETQRIIQQEVGFNAARDALELVADVFAASLEGRSFSNQIMRHYVRFGGPLV